MTNTIKLMREQIIELFTECGYPAASKWENELLLQRLNQLPAVVRKKSIILENDENKMLLSYLEETTPDVELIDSLIRTEPALKSIISEKATPTTPEKDNATEGKPEPLNEKSVIPAKIPKTSPKYRAGITQFIIELLEAGPITPEEILEALKERHPERCPAAMKRNIRYQLQQGLPLVKKLNVQKTNDNKYFINALL